MIIKNIHYHTIPNTMNIFLCEFHVAKKTIKINT